MVTTAITVPAEQPITLDASRRQLSEADARNLTHEIQRTSVRLWVLVTEAHDRKAYASLNYPTWDDYCRAELKMSPSRSYQLLDTGHVMKELAKAGANLDDMPVPTARVVAKVKGRLPEVRRTIQTAISAGEDLDKALRSLAREARTVAAEETGTETIVRAGRPPTMVVCPLCTGEGKVSRSLSRQALAWLKKKS